MLSKRQGESTLLQNGHAFVEPSSHRSVFVESVQGLASMFPEVILYSSRWQAGAIFCHFWLLELKCIFYR